LTPQINEMKRIERDKDENVPPPVSYWTEYGCDTHHIVHTILAFSAGGLFFSADAIAHLPIALFGDAGHGLEQVVTARSDAPLIHPYRLTDRPAVKRLKIRLKQPISLPMIRSTVARGLPAGSRRADITV
jgi:hypothetical protein